MIATALIKLRGKFPRGALFAMYLIMFSTLRFFLFFARGDVPAVSLGLKNGQWTALAILLVAIPALVMISTRSRAKVQPASTSIS